MKILFVHDHIFMTRNGLAYSDKLPHEVLKRYTSVFGDLTILARNRESETINDMPISSGENIDFIFLESISSFKSYFGLRKQQEAYIRSIITQYDGVIVRLPSEYGFMVAKIAKEMHIEYAVEVVGCVWDALWNYGGLKSKVYAPFVYKKMRNSVVLSDHVLYVTSQFLQKRYPASSGALTTNVSNVELPVLDETILISRLEKLQRKEPDEKIVFGTIGSLKTRYKGIHIAMEALAMLKGSLDNFEYRVLGAGSTQEYQKLAEELGIVDKVFFDGTLPSGKPIFDWLDTIDIYLQPSFQEGLPRTLIEAMSRGCPAVGSTAGGIPELLDRAMIFNPKKPKDLSTIIGTLIKDRELLEDMAKNNFENSKQYQKNILDKKRSDFWIHFKNRVENI